MQHQRRFQAVIIAIGCILPCLSVASTWNTDTLHTEIEKILSEKQHKPIIDREKSQDSMIIVSSISSGIRFSSINTDSSFYYFDRALDYSLKLKSPELISVALQKLGDYYLDREMYQQAMSYFLESLSIEERRMDPVRSGQLYDELGQVYYYLEVFEKSLDYYQKSLDISVSRGDSSAIAMTLSHLGLLHSSREFCEPRTREEKLTDFLTAIKYLTEAMDYYEGLNNGMGVAKQEQHIAAVYNKLEKPEAALDYCLRAYDYYRRSGDPGGLASVLYTLGKTYYRLKQYGKSIEAFRESEAISLKGNLTGGLQYLYEAMAMPYYDTGDYRNAYDCYIRYMTIRDSVYSSEKSQQILELEARYQNELKENEILRLKSEKRRRNTMIYSMGLVVVMLIVLIRYFIRLNRKSKIIAGQNIQIRDQKISELEKEKLYLAARAVMEGEEAERARLASDLHNGLGGLLSGIKINLSSMKENALILHDNVSAFNHALSLLDTSISELRRIAHNLMPETLSHYGLKTALEDFCTQVSPAITPVINLQCFGDDIRYSRELELTVYRIIQELVNNALKHAHATKINVQLISEPLRLFTQVTDNGIGFDVKDDYFRRGKGLENIRDRITALNGRLEIWSQPGQGTEISVEIEVT